MSVSLKKHFFIEPLRLSAHTRAHKHISYIRVPTPNRNPEHFLGYLVRGPSFFSYPHRALLQSQKGFAKAWGESYKTYEVIFRLTKKF